MRSLYNGMLRFCYCAALGILMQSGMFMERALAEKVKDSAGSSTAEKSEPSSTASPARSKDSLAIEELVATIHQLEERVRELEAKQEKTTAAAVATSSSAPSQSSAAPAPSAPQDAKPEPNPDAGFLSFFRSTELSGFVDAYYGYNFNHPTGDAPLRNFDTRHNQFSLNLAKVVLEKKPVSDHRLGFRVDLAFGPATEIVHASEPGGLGVYRNFEQGYLSYLAPVGKGLQIDVGKFVTHNGAEVIETKDNWNYSRSLLFALAIPYYHMGARATYSFNDHFALTGLLVNGWNDVVDNNNRKTLGVQAVFKPTSKLAITQNYTAGPEQLKDDRDWRNLWDTVVTYTVTPRFSLMGNYDYGMDTVSGGRVHWQGFAGYARYQANKVWALSPRFEWYDDHDGFTTGVSQAVKEFTLTSEQKIANGLFTRLEYRRDFSDKGFFPRSADRLVKAQSTVTVGVFYAFSSRGE